MRAIGRAWEAAERASVEAGIRAAALQSVSPDELPELSRRAARRGLVVLPLVSQGRPETYAAGSVPRTSSGPWDYRVAITTPPSAAPFVEAWDAGDDERLGELLGYPACCRRFFASTWGAGSVDPTWYMADHGEGPVGANILLRWLGVRPVPHLPCGFQCATTTALGRLFIELISGPERAWMTKLLAMPMLWSSLNGIGEVITPIVSLNFRSELSHELREIRREGTEYPELGAHGLRFPYRPPPARRVESESEPPEHLWMDNGFTSRQAMERAHAVIESAAQGEQPRRVVDLGCGNGQLARKLAGAEGKAFGVEIRDAVAERALAHLNEVMCADVLNADFTGWAADLCVLMPGRLIERLAPRQGLLSKLASRPCLVYAYGDWLERFRSLEGLCREAGLQGYLVGEKKADGVAAGMWEWS